MKVIVIDNYDREMRDEVMVAGPGLTHAEAKKIVQEYNDAAPMHGPDYFQAVQDDYVLRTYSP